MGRLWDYAGFAVWFVGIGYIAIWPLSTSGADGALFGGWLFCPTPDMTSALAFVCRAPHPLSFSPGLHALGVAAVSTLMLRTVYRGLRVLRRMRMTADPNALETVSAAAATLVPAPPPSKLRQLPREKARSQFGLRGAARN